MPNRDPRDRTESSAEDARIVSDRRELLLRAGALLLVARLPAIDRPRSTATTADQASTDRELDSLLARGLPTRYSGDVLERIAMPCGGVGAGQISIGGDGLLRDWLLLNGVDSDSTAAPTWTPSPRSVEFDFAFNSPRELALSSTAASKIEFVAQFPFASVAQRIAYPSDVTLGAWTPFVPCSVADSSWPIVVLSLSFDNTTATDWFARVFTSMQNPFVEAGRITEELVRAPFGGGRAVRLAGASFEEPGRVGGAGEFVVQFFPGVGEMIYSSGLGTGHSPDFEVCHTQSIAAGGAWKFECALAWHFPHAEGGRGYAKTFASADAIGRAITSERERLWLATNAWREVFYEDSTLPHWLLERIHAPVSTLATARFQIGADQRARAHGDSPRTDRCGGDAWYEAQALARLFPALERERREREDLGDTWEAGRFAAARVKDELTDEQARILLAIYREHLLSPDDAFLARHWSRVRASIEALIGADPSGDGTFRALRSSWFGEASRGLSSQTHSLALAALRAGEEMARRSSEPEFGARCRTLFELGSQNGDRELFNGNWFEYRPRDGDAERGGLAGGCFADQLAGQAWADQLGLGDLYPREHVRSAIRSIVERNFFAVLEPEMRAQAPHFALASPDEGGLVLGTWTAGGVAGIAAPRWMREVWTGIEYRVAAMCVREGLTLDALRILRAVHSRYDGRRRNPFDEFETGHHAPRALSSWEVLLAASGFEFDGPAGVIGFAPRISPSEFRSAFVAAEGFGTLDRSRSATRQVDSIRVRHGRVVVRELCFELAADRTPKSVRVELDHGERAVEVIRDGTRLRLRAPLPWKLEAPSEVVATFEV